MFVSKNLDINQKGNLTIGGVDTLELAKKYSTPLYVMDEELIRENCRLFKSSIEKYYNGNGLVCYASKAFSCKQIYRIAKDEGIGVDVVSIGELYTAMQVEFPADKICYHGNNKTAEEITLALNYGVEKIIADNITELELINNIALDLGVTAKVLLRLTPGIDAHTHDFIATGKIDSKFGMAIELGDAMEGIKKALELKNIKLMGVHCHIGSQIFDITPFEHAADVMLEFIARVKNELGYEIEILNLGGGFGIKYTQSDDPKAYDEYMGRVSEVVKKKSDKLNLKLPFIIIEPGRSIVGPAGITLYTIGNVKDIKNIRKYISVDGGMTDNIRYALYESEYDFVIANKASLPKVDTVTVAGRCCESGDLLGKDVKLQSAEAGDILAVCATGAYNYSMSNNYNRVRTPAVVMVSNKGSYIAVKGQTLEDLVRNDI